MYPPPVGPTLSADQVRQLDDAYFTADPLGYFTSRISSLLHSIEHHNDAEPSDRPDGVEASRFDRLVGEVAVRYRMPTSRAVQLQLAIDAFAVRQHAAETLLRFSSVVLRRRAASAIGSFWVDVVEAPIRLADVLAEIRTYLDDEGTRWEIFRDLVFPKTEPDDADDAETISGVTTFAEWFNFALDLFSRPTALDSPAAHNKFKHGLCVRVRDDVLVTFTDVGPDEKGNIPLSALQGERAVNLLENVVLEFVSRPQLKPKQGLEATLMNLDPVELLAQAALIAHTFAAMFCIASNAHFANRDDIDESDIPPHPGLLIDGPLPEHVTSEKAFAAMRYPLTTRPDGHGGRPAAILFADGTISEITHTGAPRPGKVVDG